MKRKKILFVLIVLLGELISGCAPRPEVIQTCPQKLSLEKNILESNILLGYTLKGDVQWKILNLNNLQEQDFDILNRVNQGLLLSIPDSRTDRVAYNIKLSPTGEWLAYVTNISFSGYYLETTDKKFSQFVPKTDYRIVYTSVQGVHRWYLMQEEYLPLSSPTTIVYPFSPNEQEKKEAVLLSTRLKDEDIASSWISFSGTKNIPALVVQSHDGSEFLSYPDWNNEWQVLQGWFDENTVMLSSHYWQMDNDLYPYRQRQDRVILFNPFTGEKNTSGNQYPQMVFGDQRFTSWPSRIVYSPMKNYLVYLERGSFNNHFAVWDIAKNSLLTRVPQQEQKDVIPPVWINEKAFIYVAESKEDGVENLFSFNIKGETEQLTYLEQAFSFPEILPLHIDLSPSKRFLSFWVTYESNNGVLKNTLLFLDVENLDVYDFCISDEGNMHKTDHYISQFWFSKQDYYVISFSFENDTERVLIIDVANRKVFSLPTPINAVLIGEIHE